MAITAAMRTQVSQLYVALFGRAPDSDGLGFWVQQLGNGASFASVAQQMFSADAARAYYPSFLTNEEIVAKFYQSVLGRAVDSDGLVFWTAKLNAKGATPGGVIAEMINSAIRYVGDDAAALRSRDLLLNKVEVGLYFAQSDIGNNIQLARYILGGITANDVTADAAKDAIDSGDVGGMWNPKVTSVTFDAATGKLVVTGLNFKPAPGDANDVIANKLTITGEGGSYTLADTANVDITSARSFTLTLSATDRAAVAALLNRDGTASTGGIAYNLAAAEDWFAGIGAAQVIADLTGNPVTVTDRGPGGTADYNLTGNDTANNLLGNRGANLIDGRGGADTMRGGDGNDSYRVDREDDVVVESSADTGGVDLVITSTIAYTLGNFLENLQLAPGALFGIGNALANVLAGNGANNFLDGREGADTLRGGAGDDQYCVDSAGDVIVESEASTGGRDEVLASISYTLGAGVENVTFTDASEGVLTGNGNALDNLMQGNRGRNRLSGGEGADTLDGGIGGDTVIGGAGADAFRFRELSRNDVVQDFATGMDRIDLSLIDADGVAGGDQAFTFIGDAAFSADATGQLRVAVVNGNLVLQGSTDADAVAEFSLQLTGAAGASAGDLIL